MPAAPVSPLEAHLGYWLRFLSNHVSARFAAQVTALGVTVTEWVAMRALFDGTATTHADLIHALGMTKGAVSKVVSRLEAKGLAERRGVAGSGKEQHILLTRRGQRLLPKLAACADANDAHFFAHLTPAQRSALMETMQALVRHHGLTAVPLE